ncbi:MAG: polyisoprenoid-binding protein YceI [Hyphomicrobiaceae bacterium]|jgi:polyisoprenoid-binding protein YceI
MEHRVRAILALTIYFCAWSITSARGYSVVATKNNATLKFHIFYFGYGKIEGRFDRLRGKLDLNEKKPANSKILIEIDTASINSNYKTRDSYLRSTAFLSTIRYPKAFFRSSAVKAIDRHTVSVKGYLTLRGITRTITIMSRFTRDPSNRRNRTFRGSTSIHLSDFGINSIPSLFATKLFLTMRIDGIRR